MLSTKNIKRILIVCAAAVSIGMTAEQTPAQYSQMAMPTWYDSGVMRQQTLNGWTLRDKARRTPSTGRTTANRNNTFKPSTATNQPLSSTGSTTFRPVAASIAPQALAAKAKDAKTRQNMQEFFADSLKHYKEASARAGAPANDVARATSYFIITAYNVASGKPMSADEAAKVKEQIQQSMLESSEFQASTNKQKQEAYETMAIMGEYIATGYVIGVQQNKPEIQKAFREVAKDQLERFLGTSLGSIRITDEGMKF